MAEYIEREVMKQALRNAHIYLNEEGVAVIEIEDIPAADVQPVVHGRWKWSEGGQCSECGFHNSNFGYNYCPHCGARMDGDDNG